MNAYYELERSRSKVAQKTGSSAALVVPASANPDSIEVTAARAEVEVEMLEADLAHRQPFARMNGLMGLTLRDSDSQ